MDYETLTTLLEILIYPIAFFIFIAIVKIGLRKRCGGGKTLIAGFVIFFFLSFFTLLIVDSIIRPPIHISWAYIEIPIGTGMIGLVAFAVLYIVGKPIFDRIKKKNTLTEEKEDSNELIEPIEMKIG